jgi:hypothetical protein
VIDYGWSNGLGNYLEIYIPSATFYFFLFSQYMQAVVGQLAYTCMKQWCRACMPPKGWFLEELFSSGLEKMASEMV